MLNTENIETFKRACDWICGGVTVATVLGWLPHISAFLTALYIAARLMETRAFQKILRLVCAKCAAWWEG